MSQQEKTGRPTNFTINGRPVLAEPGWTVLHTARVYGMYIPTLCHHPALPPYGSCRLCLVEVKHGGRARMVASCLFLPAEGMEVETHTPRVKNARRWILEMLLAKCPDSPEVQRLAAEQGVTETRFRRRDETCTLCGLCVRACDRMGVKSIGFAGRGVDRRVTTPFDHYCERGIGCGSCVNVCLHGHMRLEDEGGARRIYLGGRVINELPLVKCDKCGRYYSTEAYLEFVKTKGDTPADPEQEGRLCSDCYREQRGVRLGGGLIGPM